MKKIISLTLVLFMVVPLLLVMPMTVNAAENWLWPVNGYYNISSGYDEPRSSKLHKGIDIDESYVGNITGKPVMASKGGTATVYWGYNGGAGNYVVIEHGDGYISRYLHLDSIAISNGSVIRGQTIGYVGNTGDSSGPHLHFDIKHNGTYINNMPVNADNRHTYKWNRAEVTQNIRYDYDVSSSSNSTPGKPALIDISPYYRTNKPISFTWNATQNTTHYNLYIDKLNDGTYERLESIHYATNGLTRTLTEGQYRVFLQATNSNVDSTWLYTNSNYVYITVFDKIDNPVLKDMKQSYKTNAEIVFSWDSVENSTHYNLYIDKLIDGEYERLESLHYAESGQTFTFEKGEYRMLLQAVNSYCRTDDEKNWLFSNSVYYYFDTFDTIETPVLDNIKSNYEPNEEIEFQWNPTENTTHYNLYIDKLIDDSYERLESIHYTESGLTRKLPEGEYRVLLQATNSNYRTDDGKNWLFSNSDYFYFVVSIEEQLDKIVAVTDILLNKNLTLLAVGETETLISTVLPSNATNKNIVWSSSNNSVATVSNGVVTAVSAGTAIITAETEDGGYIATCVVTVTAPVEDVKAAFTLSDVLGKPGDTVKVKLSLKTDEAINSIAISNINYDTSLLSFVGFSDYEHMEDLTVLPPTFDADKMAIVIGLKKAATFDGDICTLNFKIKDGVDEGSANIIATSLVKNSSTVIASYVEPGTVIVRLQLLGDVDGNDTVDIDDAVALFQYSMLPELYPINYVGNVDFDKSGTVDIDDAILLFQYSMLPDLYPIE